MWCLITYIIHICRKKDRIRNPVSEERVAIDMKIYWRMSLNSLLPTMIH